MSGYHIEQVLGEATGTGVATVIRNPPTPDSVADRIDDNAADAIVLIADSDPEFAEALFNALTGRGRRVVLANTPEQAIARCSGGDDALLILNLGSPIVECLDLILQIRAGGYKPTTLIATGNITEGVDVTDMLRSPAVTGCLFKPFDPDDMLRIVALAQAS